MIENYDLDFIMEINYTARNQLAKVEGLITFAPMAKYHGTFSELTKKERTYDIFIPF